MQVLSFLQCRPVTSTVHVHSADLVGARFRSTSRKEMHGYYSIVWCYDMA